MINVAIISPSKDAASETFIKAHREFIKGNIHYLYGGLIPTESLNGKIGNTDIISKVFRLLPAFLYDRIKWSPAKHLETYLQKNNIQVVFAEYGQTGSAVLPVCKKLSLPLIVHFHGYDASKNSVLELYKDRYRKMFDYATFIIAVSGHMKKKLLEIGAPASKLVHSVYGPHPKFFEINPDYASCLFLSVGRFVEKKAPYLTLMAFKQLQDKQPTAKLIMVGDGPLLSVCKNLACSIGITNVEFKGALQHDQVLDLFSRASCFVQHSVTADNGDTEGTPVAILEAGAAGLPVISTFHGGIPDIIIHGKTGFLVNEGDITAMAKFMEDIFTSESLRTELGKQARKHIAANFTLQKHIDTIDELIRQSCPYPPPAIAVRRAGLKGN